MKISRRLSKSCSRKPICFVFCVVIAACYYLSTKCAVYTNVTHTVPSVRAKLSFIDIDTLKFTYSSNVCVYRKPKIIILVTSHVSNLATRNAIRRSRPRDLLDKFDAQLIFLVAMRSANSSRQHAAETGEFREHGDLVQGDFIEAYRNLTRKHLMGLRWIRDYCSSVSYVVKMDDDIVVNFYKLFEILNKFKPHFDLLGHRIAGMKPIRDRDNKWYVSEDEFSGPEYPTFLSGWLYVMTTRAVTAILSVSKAVPYFWIDDVLVSGILREKANLKLIDISQHFRYEPKNIECCILNKYSCDFLAAPSGKNFALLLKLSDHLWECRYKKLCKLESNLQRSCWFSTNNASLTDQSRWFVKEIDAYDLANKETA